MHASTKTEKPMTSAGVYVAGITVSVRAPPAMQSFGLTDCSVEKRAVGLTRFLFLLQTICFSTYFELKSIALPHRCSGQGFRMIDG